MNLLSARYFPWIETHFRSAERRVSGRLIQVVHSAEKRMGLDLSNGIQGLIESAVKAGVASFTAAEVAKLPPSLQGPANTAIAADEAFALAALETYGVALVAKAVPNLAPALKAAFPNVGL